jgi:hypothetical protein
MKTNFKIWFPALLLLWSLTSCQKDSSSESDTSPLTISFSLMAYGAPIDTSFQYTNFSGEKFNISSFKFYITAIAFSNETSNVSEKTIYHLVDLAQSASQQFTVNLKAGQYNKISFSVGVDSARNVSGAQTGALDPTNGMFWTWNTGYIFAKLEGRSPSSPAPFQKLTHHIGGFRTGENAIRNVSLDAPFEVGRTKELVINADIQEWFDGAHQISIASNASVMSPGGIALRVADNYAGMFSVNKVVNP